MVVLVDHFDNTRVRYTHRSLQAYSSGHSEYRWVAKSWNFHFVQVLVFRYHRMVSPQTSWNECRMNTQTRLTVLDKCVQQSSRICYQQCKEKRSSKKQYEQKVVLVFDLTMKCLPYPRQTLLVPINSQKKSSVSIKYRCGYPFFLLSMNLFAKMGHALQTISCSIRYSTSGKLADWAYKAVLRTSSYPLVSNKCSLMYVLKSDKSSTGRWVKWCGCTTYGEYFVMLKVLK